MPVEHPIIIATRGSALALAQANWVAGQCRQNFPSLRFELKVITTTGDKMQTASLAKAGEGLPKGLFTKELEVALLNGEADLAVHSLKDLPTELPVGLMLAATPPREDVRDVFIYRTPGSPVRGFPPHVELKDFPQGATIATSSTRRKMSVLATRPDLNIVEIRGNVPTRLQKIAGHTELDATILALAGLTRLHFKINADGTLAGEKVPENIFASVISLEAILPCVGQGALGIETRSGDERIAGICAPLNHAETFCAVSTERAFLRGMGGGCQSPVAAYAQVIGGEIRMNAISFHHEIPRRSEGARPMHEAVLLGEQMAAELK